VCVQNFCVSVNCTESYGATDAGDPIVFGAAIPFTDSTGAVDKSERVDFESALLALDEVNQPGRSPRPIALYACDTQGDTGAKLQAELNYLLAQKKAVAVLTSQSGLTLAALGTTLSSHALLITATATATEIASKPAIATGPAGGPVRMLWRTAPSDSIQGAVIANEIANNPRADPYLNNITRVGVLYDDDAYGQGLSGVIAGALPGTLTVQTFQYTRGGDPSSALSSLDAFHPDITVAIGFPSDLVGILNKADTLTNLSAAAFDAKRMGLDLATPLVATLKTDGAGDVTLLGVGATRVTGADASQHGDDVVLHLPQSGTYTVTLAAA
jgi:ABC-type branched-subunit amino acid transport system substrate-binding protein